MISVNCMIKNEPFAFYSLVSLAPHVDEIVLVDTGSEQKYLDALNIAGILCPNIRFFSKPLNDGHGWKVENGEVKNANEEIGKQLGDIRRWMQEESKGNIIWILDGDEIYSNNFAKNIVKFINNNVFGFTSKFMQNIDACHLPFYDFFSKTEVRLKHNMGRLFKKDKVEIKGNYPFEMHHKINGPCITNTSPNNYNWGIDGFVFHMEAIVKPWRKEVKQRIPYHGKWPEVFEEYKDVKEAKQLIEQYGF